MTGLAGACIGATYPTLRLLRPLDRDRRLPHRMAGLVWGDVAFRAAPWWNLDVRGRENLPTDGPYLLCPNHQSFMDVPALYGLGASFKWVLDRRFMRVPVFAAWMRACGYVAVDPTDPSSVRRMLEEMERWLRRGMPVAVFPEGTRSRDGRVGPMRRGPFRVAMAVDAPVVPVVIRGTREILPKKRLTCETTPPWDVHVNVLPPLAPSDFASPLQLSKACRRALVSGLADA
jgi:1-acyl-sn-glycerol-3-phosphate acyltransferase